MVSFSAEKVGSVPLREISFCNVTTPSQLPGHLVVIDMPDNESAQVQSKIKSFIETSLDFNATLMDEVQRRSWAYTKAAPRWALDVWFRDKDAFKLAAFVAELWNAIESDSALIGVAKMERMRGGEFLLDCRGVAALQNPDIQANIDFALPVSFEGRHLDAHRRQRMEFHPVQAQRDCLRTWAPSCLPLGGWTRR